MCVDSTGGNDIPFARNHLGSRPNNNVHAWLHIGIAGFPNRRNPPILNRNIGLYNSPVIENECVGDYGIDRAFLARPLGLSHSIADNLSASKLHFLAVVCEILV